LGALFRLPLRTSFRIINWDSYVSTNLGTISPLRASAAPQLLSELAYYYHPIVGIEVDHFALWRI
jgi:hypothetical protein